MGTSATPGALNQRKIFLTPEIENRFQLTNQVTIPGHLPFPYRVPFSKQKVLICLIFPILIPSIQSPKAEYNLYLHTPAYVCSPARLAHVSAKKVSVNGSICPPAPTQSYRPAHICNNVAFPLC